MNQLKRGLVAVLAIVVCACSTVESPVIPDVVYGHKDGLALFYDVLKPTGKSNGAGIIYIVSGGWFSMWQDPMQRRERFTDLLDAGYTVFAVHHGSAPLYKVPDAYHDVSRAVRHIRANAASYGVDPERLGVTGASAGGHLALMIGTNSDEGVQMSQEEKATPATAANAQVPGFGQNRNRPDPLMGVSNRVAAVVAYFPPVDLRQMVGRGGERFPALDFDKDEAAAVSPILFVTPDDPPTLLMHGDADTLVNISNSQRMYAAFEEKGVATDFITFPGEGHGFRKPEDQSRSAEARLKWFNRYLLPNK